MTKRMIGIRMLMGGLLAIALSGCDADTSTAPRTVHSVTVSPASAELRPGETLHLGAVARDRSGGVVTGMGMTWGSGSETVATVSATGLVTAVGEGTTEITAATGTVVGRTTLVVAPAIPGPAHSVHLDRVVLALEEGQMTTLTATARDAAGREIDDAFVRWASSHPDVVQVDPFGLVEAVKVGVARITATVGGASAAADVAVSAHQAHDLLYDMSVDVGVAPELFRLSLRDPAATPERIFPEGRHAMDAAVSPDGARVAFIVMSQGRSALWTADLDGENATELVGAPGFVEHPTWSPDGAEIAYRLWDPLNGGGSDIWVVAAAGGTPVNLTSDQVASSEEAPSWSPEASGGSLIAFTRIADGKAHIWTMKPDGSDKIQITDGNVADMNPAWSPDGSRIVFERYGPSVGTGGDLFLVSPTGSGLFRLTSLPYGQFDPAFSPDGRLVAFSSQTGGVRQIFTIWTDGTKLAQRTFGPRDRERPTWFRD